MGVSIPGKSCDAPNFHFPNQDNMGSYFGIFANLFPMVKKIIPLAGMGASHPVGIRIKLKPIHPFQII